MSDQETCSCDKIRYETRAEARSVAASMRRRGKVNPRSSLHVYQCREGGWHVGNSDGFGRLTQPKKGHRRGR